MRRTMFHQILNPILEGPITFVLDESLIDLSLFEVVGNAEQLLDVCGEGVLTGDVAVDADAHLFQLETDGELVPMDGEAKYRLTTL